MKTYIFDIDGTICTQSIPGDYSSSKPIQERIDKINLLYQAGNKIIFLTARGMGRTKNNVIESYKLFYDLTKKQLISWDAKHHDLFLGKPAGDFYIDDKGIRDEDFFTN
jgi:ribonucleotide monophosphatase NagD (HAD superfamily)